MTHILCFSNLGTANQFSSVKTRKNNKVAPSQSGMNGHSALDIGSGGRGGRAGRGSSVRGGARGGAGLYLAFEIFLRSSRISSR